MTCGRSGRKHKTLKKCNVALVIFATVFAIVGNGILHVDANAQDDIGQTIIIGENSSWNDGLQAYNDFQLPARS